MGNELKQKRWKNRADRNPEPDRLYIKDVNAKARGEVTAAENAYLQLFTAGKYNFVTFCEKLVGVRVHPGQIKVVQKLDEKPYLVLTAGNAWGKTLLIALVALWFSCYKRHAAADWGIYKVVVVGPEFTQAHHTHAAIEALRTGGHRGQHWDRGPGADGKWHPFLLGNLLVPDKQPQSRHIMFRWKHNGAQILFKPAVDKLQALEGTDPNLIIYDEFRKEMYPEVVVNEIMIPRGPRVPGFKFALVSTPQDASLAFQDFLKKGLMGHPDWNAHEGSTRENYFLDKEDIDQAVRNVPVRLRAQILEGKIVPASDAFFDRDSVLAIFEDGDEPENIDKFRGKAVEGHWYVGGVDLAESATGDSSVITVWDCSNPPPYRVVYERVLEKGTKGSKTIAICDAIIDEFGPATQIGYDVSGALGSAFTNNTVETANPGAYVPVTSSGGAKLANLLALRDFIEKKNLVIPNIEGLRQQMVGYKRKDDRLITDRLMAQTYAAQVAKQYLPTQTSVASRFDDVGGWTGGTGALYASYEEDGLSEGRRTLMEWVANSATESDATLDEVRMPAEEIE